MCTHYNHTYRNNNLINLDKQFFSQIIINSIFVMNISSFREEILGFYDSNQKEYKKTHIFWYTNSKIQTNLH